MTGKPGQVTVAFRPTQQASLGAAVEFWLPRALSHEVDHSVRILAGPGIGSTLLPQIISEGISSVFDESQAFPGPPNPWDRAISPSQECTLWNTAQLDLEGGGLYDVWMFGSPGHTALDGVHHRLRHRQGLPGPASAGELVRADLHQRGHDPGRQRLPALREVTALEGHVEVGARGGGFEPDEQAGEGRLGQGQVAPSPGHASAALRRRSRPAGTPPRCGPGRGWSLLPRWAAGAPPRPGRGAGRPARGASRSRRRDTSRTHRAGRRPGPGATTRPAGAGRTRPWRRARSSRNRRTAMPEAARTSRIRKAAKSQAASSASASPNRNPRQA